MYRRQGPSIGEYYIDTVYYSNIIHVYYLCVYSEACSPPTGEGGAGGGASGGIQHP